MLKKDCISALKIIRTRVSLKGMMNEAVVITAAESLCAAGTSACTHGGT